MGSYNRYACKKYRYCLQCGSSFTEWTPRRGWHCLMRACGWQEAEYSGPGLYGWLTGHCYTEEQYEKRWGKKWKSNSLSSQS